MRFAPNCFVGYRLDSAEFRLSASRLQSEASRRHPAVARALTPVAKLHITGFVMRLSSQEQVDAAVAAVRGAQARLLLGPGGCALTMEGVDTFGDRVLFMQPAMSESLAALEALNRELLARCLLSEALQDAAVGLRLVRLDAWHPHVTLAKVRGAYQTKDRRELGLDAESMRELSAQARGLEAPVLSVDLLSMEHADETGYYMSLASLGA